MGTISQARLAFGSGLSVGEPQFVMLNEFCISFTIHNLQCRYLISSGYRYFQWAMPFAMVSSFGSSPPLWILI